MAVTSKSPVAVTSAALAMARRALPAYSHVCSPKKFTQHQLFACLVLKNFLKTDYRGVAAHLTDHPVLTQTVLELRCVPHYTTFQKASRRLLAWPQVRKLLGASIRMLFCSPGTAKLGQSPAVLLHVLRTKSERVGI